MQRLLLQNLLGIEKLGLGIALEALVVFFDVQSLSLCFLLSITEVQYTFRASCSLCFRFVLMHCPSAGVFHGERFDPRQGHWEALAPLRTARHALATASVDGAVYALGGVGEEGVLSSVERYDATAGVCYKARNDF